MPQKKLIFTLAVVSLCSSLVAQQISLTEYPLPTPFSTPYGIVSGSDGALWFTELFGFKIGRISTTGSITEYPIPWGTGAYGITSGPDGALWFAASVGGQSIGRITTSGAFTQFNLPQAFGAPSALTAGPDGAVWFGAFSTMNLGRITTSGVVTTFHLPAPDSSVLGGITTGPDGALWFTESGYDSLLNFTGVAKIGRVNTSGVISEFRLPSSRTSPTAIVAGPDGALWFTESLFNTAYGPTGPAKIGRITTDGVITEFPLPEDGANPGFITVGPDGALWFNDQAANKIGRINREGAINEFTLFPTSYQPMGITTGPDGALWFAEFGRASTDPSVGNRIGRAAVIAAVPLRIAQIADGSSWKTLFQVINLDQVPVTYSFQFRDDNGNPLQLPFLSGPAGTFAGTVPVGGTAFAETPGTAAALTQGWATVTSSGRIGALTIFRQRVSGRPDSEGTVTGVQSGNRVFLPFDNTNGFVTGIAIANTNATQTLVISLAIQADSGATSMGSLSLPPNAHTAFVLTSMFPALAGLRGSVTFTASTPDISVIGLRVSPTNSFTSLGVFQ